MTDTLEKAIDWMARALREARENLDEVQADMRHVAVRSASMYIATRVVCLPNGAGMELGRYRITWHGITGFHQFGNDPCYLSVFDDWLAHARAKAAQQ